jgi:hypothetical protein
MTIRLRGIAILFLTAVLLSACANPVYTLYGTWRSADPSAAGGGLTLEFRQDGHLMEINQGLTQEALFELKGDNLETIVIKPKQDSTGSGVTELNYRVDGDQLLLAVPGSPQPLTFTRLK